MKKMLDFITWIISITLGTIGIYLMNTQNLGFFKTILYGIIFCLVTLILNMIIVKIRSKGNFMQCYGLARLPMTSYFVVHIIGFIIFGIIEKASLFNIILAVILGILWFDFLPLCITFAHMDIEPLPDDYKSSNSKEHDLNIKNNDIYDKFGNKIGSATTYDDGVSGMKKTYVTDRLGNTVAESTTVGNHTTTKINTTGRY